MLTNVRRMLNERRAHEAIASVGATLPRTIAGMSLADRAAVMIVAHAMLRDAAGEYGQDLIARPLALPKPALSECLARLGAVQRKLAASLEAVSDRAVGDVVYSGVLRQIRATEVVIVTVGMALDKSLGASVKGVWKYLWEARTHAVDGVRLIKAFERTVKERALPASQPKDPERMARLATTLPALFKSVPKRSAR